MKNTIQIISLVLLAILFIDFLGFTAWIISGQYPVDNFYIGSITANLLKLVLA